MAAEIEYKIFLSSKGFTKLVLASYKFIPVPKKKKSPVKLINWLRRSTLIIDSLLLGGFVKNLSETIIYCQGCC